MTEPAQAGLFAPVAAVRIEVAGVPVPKGSHKIVHAKYPKPGKPKAWIVDDNPHQLATWAKDIATAARTAWQGRAAMLGPVYIGLTFYMPARVADLDRVGGLRPGDQHLYPISYPDLDKLTRAVWDALKVAGVYRDDGQVTDAGLRKRRSPRWVGVVIRVKPATEVGV